MLLILWTLPLTLFVDITTAGMFLVPSLSQLIKCSVFLLLLGLLQASPYMFHLVKK